MKMLTIAMTLLLSVGAMAAEIKVMDMQVWGNQRAVGSFGLNEELGRAWVEISVDSSFDSESTPDEYRVKLDELRFDPSTKQVLLTVDGAEVECAVVKKRGVSVFRHSYLKATGCEFKSKVVRVDFDNGYEIEKRNYLQVFLVTK